MVDRFVMSRSEVSRYTLTVTSDSVSPSASLIRLTENRWSRRSSRARSKRSTGGTTSRVPSTRRRSAVGAASWSGTRWSG